MESTEAAIDRKGIGTPTVVKNIEEDKKHLS